MAEEHVLDVSIVDPDRVIYEGKAIKVFAPGRVDELAILPDHTPLYSELITGKVVVEEASGKTFEKQIEGGVVRIKDNTVKILVGF